MATPSFAVTEGSGASEMEGCKVEMRSGGMEMEGERCFFPPRGALVYESQGTSALNVLMLKISSDAQD